MIRTRLAVGLVGVVAACGGGGGGPSGPSGFPDVEGTWSVDQTRVGGSCTQIPFSPFTAVITRTGSTLRLVITADIGEVVFTGTLQADGSFDLMHAGVLQGIQSQSTVTGQFNNDLMTADEEQVITPQSDPTLACNFLWRWSGIRN